MTITKEVALDAAEAMARDAMRKAGGITLQVIGHAEKGIHAVTLQDAWQKGDIAKQIAVAMVRDLFQREGVTAYVVVSESWMSRHVVQGRDMAAVDRKLTELRQQGRRPANDPDRMECVTLYAGDADGQASRVFKIVRDDKGKGELERLPDVHTSMSIFDGLIPVAKTKTN